MAPFGTLVSKWICLCSSSRPLRYAKYYDLKFSVTNCKDVWTRDLLWISINNVQSHHIKGRCGIAPIAPHWCKLRLWNSLLFLWVQGRSTLSTNRLGRRQEHFCHKYYHPKWMNRGPCYYMVAMVRKLLLLLKRGNGLRLFGVGICWWQLIGMKLDTKFNHIMLPLHCLDAPQFSLASHECKKGRDTKSWYRNMWLLSL
jgi:hypothetical protein